MLIRLDKYLADMQVGTRSEVKELIRKKRVTVNDNIVTKPESKINTDGDSVNVDGNAVGYHEYEYFMLNKPAGVVSATDDNTCTTVIDLIKTNNRKDLFPVGRLDKDTEGLLIITNDGAMAHDLLSPKKHVDKTYYAKVKGKISDMEVKQFANGLFVDEELTALPAILKVLILIRAGAVFPLVLTFPSFLRLSLVLAIIIFQVFLNHIFLVHAILIQNLINLFIIRIRQIII